MANDAGGRTDKVGNRYEKNCIIYTILQVVEEKFKSCSFENLGEEEIATDIKIVDNNGHNIYIQCKERFGNKNQCSLANLKKYDLFIKWKNHLERNNDNEVAIQTPLSCVELEDLNKKALNNSGDPSAFFDHQIKNTTMYDIFRRYCNYNNLNMENKDDIKKAMDYLKRTRTIQMPDYLLAEIIVQKIECLFLGDSKNIYSEFIRLVSNSNKFGHIIDNNYLEIFFKENNILRRDLSNDKKDFHNIYKLNYMFKNSLNLINETYIERNEFETVKKYINDGKSVIIHGKAGFGKSGIMHNLTKYLDQNEILYLAIKLDKYIPEYNIANWSLKLGFNIDVTYLLDKFSNDNKCVLILDQLDALRWTNIHNRTAIDVCNSIINEIENINKFRKEKISIVFACRTFDYENDASIKKLFANEDWKKVQVGLLSEHNVANIIGKKYYNYSSKLKELLRVPNNLFIWTKLNENNSLNNVHTTGNLISRWWSDIEDDARNNGINNECLINARDKIIQNMNDHNRIYAISKILNIDSQIINYLCSKQFLISMDGKLSFPHQSIYDYYVVLKMIENYESGKKIIDLVGDFNNQLPNKRYQLQMFLEYIYDFDKDEFFYAIKEIIESSEIRIYMKYVAFEVLGSINEISKKIEDYILSNYDKEIYFDEYMDVVLYGHQVFIDLFIQKDIFNQWISDSQKQPYVIKLLKSINNSFNKIEIKFIENSIRDSKNFDYLLFSCLSHDIITDSEDVFSLRKIFYSKYPDLIGNLYIDFNELIKFSEERTIQILKLLVEVGKKVRYIKYDNNVYLDYSSTMTLVQNEKVIDELIPIVPIINNEYKLDDWKFVNTEYSANRIVMILLKIAIENLMIIDPEKAFNKLQKYMGIGSLLHNELILSAMIVCSNSYSNEIITYIFNDIEKNCFEYSSGSKQSITLVKNVIENHITFINDDTLAQIDYKLNHYKSSKYIEHYKYIMTNKNYSTRYAIWGRFQHEVLNVIPDNVLTNNLLQLKQMLNRKYGNQISYDNTLNTRHYNVVSPILNKKITNNNWLKILSSDKVINARKTRFDEKKHLAVESSIGEFKISLSSEISKDPIRFINLFINNHDKIKIPFIYTLFNSIAYSENLNQIPNDILEKLFFSFDIPLVDYNLYTEICSIISRKKDSNWSLKTIKFLKKIYDYIENGLIKENRISHVENNKEESKIDIAEKQQVLVLNSSIGIFAKAIANVLKKKTELYCEFEDIIHKLANSSKWINKYSCLLILDSILDNDYKFVSNLYIDILKDPNTYSFWNNRKNIFIIYEKCIEKREILHKIIISASAYESKQVKEEFSYLMVDLYMNFDACKEQVLNENTDEVIVEAFTYMCIQYLQYEETKERAKLVILKINKYSSLKINSYTFFNGKYVNLKDDLNFILKIFENKKNSHLIEGFIDFLKNNETCLLQYDNLIFEILINAINGYDKNNENYYYAYDDLSFITVKLYDETYDSKNEFLITKCLDIWDLMFKKNIGSTRQLSKKITDI